MKKRKGQRRISVRSTELAEAIDRYVASLEEGEKDKSDITRTALHEWLLREDPRYAREQSGAKRLQSPDALAQQEEQERNEKRKRGKSEDGTSDKAS